MPARRGALSAMFLAIPTIVALGWATPHPARAATASATFPPGMTANPPAMMKMAGSFPQPVRVGDLAGRYVLRPTEAQTVLGHVGAAPVLRAEDGSLWLAVDRREWFGLRSTRVAVPVDQVALLGEHVAMIGVMPADFAELPPLEPGKFVAVPPETIIRVGIVGPFH